MSPVFSNSRHLQVITPSKARYKDLAVYHSRDYLDAVLDPSQGANQASNGAEFGLEDVSTDSCNSLLVTLLVSGEWMLRTARHFWVCPTMSNWLVVLPSRRSARFTTMSPILPFVGMVEGYSSPFAFISFQNVKIRHHAQKSFASGFCYVADCILAILAIKRGMPLNTLAPSISSTIPQKPRIMYLDLDLHYSDAVSDAFYAPLSTSPPQILVSLQIDQISIYLIFCRL